MRVFLSWSGETSHSIALIIRDWLPQVLQEVQPFISSHDIAKGERGLDIIARNLQDTDFGIVVITESNKGSPWINFEAGALSKSLQSGHVVPLICGMSEIDITGSPLRQFQYSFPTLEGIQMLVTSVNQHCTHPVAERVLERAFAKWWPEFEGEYKRVDLAGKDAKKAKPDTPERLENAISSLIHDVGSMRSEFVRIQQQLAEDARRRSPQTILPRSGSRVWASPNDVAQSNLERLLGPNFADVDTEGPRGPRGPRTVQKDE